MIRTLFYPHVLIIIIAAVLLFTPTPLEYLKSERNIKENDFQPVEQAPFVVIPEPGEH